MAQITAQGVVNSGFPSVVNVGDGTNGNQFSRNLAVGEHCVVAVLLDSSLYRGVVVTDPVSGNTFSKIHPDAVVTASIAATGVMTVTGITSGSLKVGQFLYFAGIAATIKITSQLTGTAGSTGTYQTTGTTVVASTTINAEVYNFVVSSYRKYELWRSTITVAGPCRPRATADGACEMMAIMSIAFDNVNSSTPFTAGEYCDGSAQPLLSDGTRVCSTGNVPAAGGTLASQPALFIAFFADLSFNTAPTISGFDTDLGAFWQDLNTTTPTASLRIGIKRLTSTAQTSASALTSAAFVNTISFGLMLKEAAAGTPGNASGAGVTDNATAPAATAQSLSSVSVTLKNNAGTPLNTVARRFWTRTTPGGAAVDGGASGLSITCNSAGVFNLSNLSIPGGAGWLTYKDPSDDLNCHTVPVTFA